MHRAIAVLIALILPVPLAAAPVRQLPVRQLEIAPKEVILGWINQYRHHPDPEQVPLAVRGLSRLGALSDTEGAGVYVGFLAGIFAKHPDRIDALIARMLPLTDDHQWAIVRAIAYSGLPDWRTVLQRNAERMPARRVMIERFLAGKLPTLDQAPIEKDETWGDRVRQQMLFVNYFSKPRKDFGLDLTPDVLDTLWGYFYATGDYRPLGRIVLMLRWTKERDVLEKLTLGSMAKYTLAINSGRNPDLLAKLKWAETQPQPDTVKPVLKEIIEAAETVETGKMRNDALAAIEELKRKGPGSRRDLSIWGQVGEGALAVGCIVLAVTGQVEFGIPCVVGGGRNLGRAAGLGHTEIAEKRRDFGLLRPAAQVLHRDRGDCHQVALLMGDAVTSYSL
ncbi:MAG: hypothetical protein WDO17_23795 [Alphaproteobacteria bacterium]